MTSFSFVSTHIGIPFATSIGALALINCSAAVRYVKNGYTGVFSSCFVSSCVECLGTEGACGGVFMEVSVVEYLTLALYLLE